MTQRGRRPEIAIRVRAIAQLFSSLDPSPFNEKDLDPAAHDHIVEWARELPPDALFNLVIHLPPEEAEKPECAEVGPAITHYFREAEENARRQQRELFRIGRMSLLIGTTVLVACLGASQLLAPLIPNPTAARVVEESLILVGWVANWRPLEIYLYDWWPIRRRVRLYERIAGAPVLVRKS